jgi:hypothetical protein
LVSLEEVEVLSQITSLIIITKDIGSKQWGPCPKSDDAKNDIAAIKQSGVQKLFLSTTIYFVNCTSIKIFSGFQRSEYLLNGSYVLI